MSLRALTPLSRTLLRAPITTPLRIATRPVLAPCKMASIIQSTASAAHSAFASLASTAEIKKGDAVPDVEVRINGLEEGDKVNFSKLPGKNILVLVPGAFTPTCSSQVPGYIEHYADLRAAGVADVYVVSVNDMFVVNAWKKTFADSGPHGADVKFAADDQAALAHALGLVLDAQGLLGGPRLKRGVVIIQDGKVVDVVVEPNPGESTVTQADSVIKTLQKV
ncbi:hypothetical protein Q5752_005745 [Cryptotrichosporon argae]